MANTFAYGSDSIHIAYYLTMRYSRDYSRESALGFMTRAGVPQEEAERIANRAEQGPRGPNGSRLGQDGKILF